MHYRSNSYKQRSNCLIYITFAPTVKLIQSFRSPHLTVLNRTHLLFMRLGYCCVTYRPRIKMGVITKLLQEKDSFHCIALFNVTQLYENLKTNKNKQKNNRTHCYQLNHTLVGKQKKYFLKR